MSNELNQIVHGKLIQPYKGYSIGAELFYLWAGCSFAIIKDEIDTEWGFVLHTHDRPEISILRKLELTERNDGKFFAYYSIISDVSHHIMADFKLQFTYEKTEKDETKTN